MRIEEEKPFRCKAILPPSRVLASGVDLHAAAHKAALPPETSPTKDRAKMREARPVSGGLSAGVPPVPIPNTVVKAGSADDTWGATLWENRSPPE